MPKFKEIAPYGTYGTLKSTIERFKESTVPTKLNRHVLHDVSGGAFSALISGLRFFGLVNEDQSVRDEFRELVEAARKGDADYKDRLTEIVCDAYGPIVGDFDLDAGTLPDLEKKFRDAGIPQGQMVTKAIRFYLKALEDAGLKVSEHITKKRVRGTKPKGAKAQKKSKANGNGGGDFQPDVPTNTGRAVQDAAPSGFERLTMPGMKDAFIQYPSKLTKRDYDLLKALLTVLGAYVSLDEEEEGRKP